MWTLTAAADVAPDHVREPAHRLLALVPRLPCAVYVYLGTFVVVGLLLLAPTPYQAHVVTGTSMAPVLTPGDIVIVDPTASPSPGDVITYRQGGRTITHRVRTVNDDGTFQTRGDSNAAPDSTPVPPGSLVGQVGTFLPLAGAPLVWWGTGRYASLLLWAVVTGAALYATVTFPSDQDGRR